MRPGPGLIRLLLAWTLLGAAGALWAPLLFAWAAGGLALAAAAAGSWSRLRRAPVPRVDREAAPSLPLGVFSPVRLRLPLRPPVVQLLHSPLKT